MALSSLTSESVGLLVRVKLTSGDPVEGVVFAYDSEMGILVLYEKSDHPNRSNFRFYKPDSIAELTIVDPSTTVKMPEPLNADSKLSKLNVGKMCEKTRTAIYNREHKLGHDVTIEAQDIFDALSRTLPCSWEQSSIIVLGEVRIDSPYTLEKVHAWSGGSTTPSSPEWIENTVERVKKVLDGERQKLKGGSRTTTKKAQ